VRRRPALQTPGHLAASNIEHLLAKTMKQPQKNRSLVTTCQTSGSASLTSVCEHQPTSPPPRSQHASFGPPSSCGNPTTTLPMAHCNLSGPSTAAQLRRTLLDGLQQQPSLSFSSAVGRRHRQAPPTTTLAEYFFYSSASSSSLLSKQPEPGFERDWPVPDDDVHYC
jgi:hypothetical protein